MPKKLSPEEAERFRKALEPGLKKRLGRTGYLINDDGAADRRRAKPPPERDTQSRAEIADTLSVWYKAAGLARKREPASPGVQPDMHDGVKKLPQKIKVKALVNDLKVTSGGTFLQFDFKTTVPCIPLICARQGPLDVVKADGSYKLTAEPEYTSLLGAMFSGHRTSHSIALTNLKPRSKFNNQMYRYVILLKPKEENYPWIPAKGGALTLRRHVILTVDNAHVMDATDFDGAGEMYFKSQLGHPGFNFNIPGNSLDFAIHPATNQQGGAGDGFMHVSSGDVVPLNFNLFGKEIREGIEHTFSAVESDAGSAWPGSLSTHGTDRKADKYEGTYDTGKFEAASAHWTYKVDGGTLMSGKNGDPLREREQYSVEYARQVSGGVTTDLKYIIHGRITVFYSV
jgi:hypothetical protein